jgi:glycosyltransferase involved in cell wall biosynthesis
MAELFAINVVLRTHNRAHLIEAALDSVMAADRSGIDLHIFIVDNASTDQTSGVLARLASNQVTTLREPRQGGQFALNTAIAQCRAPVIAFFDDDERVDPEWLQVVAREMRDANTDFIAGPCRPLWGDSSAPAWLPAGYGGVLGIINNGDQRTRYTSDFKGMLTQGNCAVRRSIYDEAGPYPAEFTTAEDRWLYGWLIEQGKVGYYCPDLVINHIMQADRLNKNYFRRWAAREGRDRAACDRLVGNKGALAKPWFWKKAAKNLLHVIASPIMGTSNSAQSFEAELELRQALAHIYWLMVPRGGG